MPWQGADLCILSGHLTILFLTNPLGVKGFSMSTKYTTLADFSKSTLNKIETCCRRSITADHEYENSSLIASVHPTPRLTPNVLLNE